MSTGTGWYVWVIGWATSLKRPSLGVLERNGSFNPRMIRSRKNPAKILINSGSHELGRRSTHHGTKRTANFPGLLHCMHVCISRYASNDAASSCHGKVKWRDPSWDNHSDKDAHGVQSYIQPHWATEQREVFNSGSTSWNQKSMEHPNPTAKQWRYYL
jgi:hypothetical protein